MVSLIAFVIGLVYGGWRAKRRGGNWMDMVQYALVFGLIALVISLIFVAFAGRQGWI